MTRRKNVAAIVVVTLIVIVLANISLFLFAQMTIVDVPTVVVAMSKGASVADIPIVLAKREVERKQTRLLCQTDYQALLDACRGVARRAISGELEEDAYMGWELLRFPKPIRRLRPNHVAVGRDGLVKIEMFTGWHSFGVWAFPESYQGPPVAGQEGYGDRILIEGLWYYDVGYLHMPDEYDKAIDAILIKCRKIKAPG